MESTHKGLFSCGTVTTPGKTSNTIAMQSQNHLFNSFSPSSGDFDNLKVKLQKILDSVQDSIQQIECDLEVAEELLRDTKSKLNSLQSQMVDMRTTVVEIYSRKRSSGVAQLDNRPQTAAKRIRFGEETSDSSVQPSVSENDPSAEELKAICSDMSGRDAKVVTEAALEAKGVLSPQEFLTFLYLARQVDDPVQLARVSFTGETTPLYYQLKTFLHKLDALDKSVQEAQGASQSDRPLADEFRALVEAFRNHMTPKD